MTGHVGIHIHNKASSSWRGWHHRDLLCCVMISHDNRAALIDMAVILLPKNHRIEYEEELSERFKAGQNRSTVTALKYTQIDKHLLVREI